MARCAFAALGPLGIEAQLEPVRAKPVGWQPDLIARIRRGGDRETFQVEVKRGLRPVTLAPLIARFQKAGVPALLVADYVTPAMAETLRAAHVAFIDLAGNVYLELPGHTCYVVGRKPAKKTDDERPVRIFQAAGLRVLFLFLCDPERILLPTRQLAEQAGVANGTVGWVLKDLTRLGYLYTLKRRRIFKPDRKLLDRWVEAYEGQLRHRLIRARYWTDEVDWWRQAEFDGNRFALGGEAAAYVLTHYLRGITTTIYQHQEKTTEQDEQQIRQWMKLARMHGAEKWNVEFLYRFWPDDIVVEKRGTVPAVLVYADLMMTGDERCIETAGMIYEQYLAERFGKN